MRGSQRHYAKWKKGDREHYITIWFHLYDILKRQNNWQGVGHKTDQWLSGAGGKWAKGRTDCKVNFWGMMQMFYILIMLGVYWTVYVFENSRNHTLKKVDFIVYKLHLNKSDLKIKSLKRQAYKRKYF